MHRQDTARINAEAVGDRLRSRGLKQYMVARQVGVEPLTVNRWLTGKVRRISRDNLSRLATVLGCSEAEISFADEADVRATRIEQSQAADLLLEQRARLMFEVSDDYTLYETLLKAVMHPNMSAAELAGLYAQLAVAAGRQSRFAQVLEYGRLALEHAERSGDTDVELVARTHIAAARGEQGQLPLARRELEQISATASSIGNQRGLAQAQTNLVHVYRLSGDVRKAHRAAEVAIPLMRGLGLDSGAVFAAAALGSALRDCGRLDLAERCYNFAVGVQGPGTNARGKVLARLFRLDLQSLHEDSAEDAAAQMELLLPDIRAVGRLVEDNYCTPSSVLRRGSRLEAAAAWIEETLAQDWLSPYDPAFLHAEAARICTAQHDLPAAHRRREIANELFAARGMQLYVTNVAGGEVTELFIRPARLKLRFA